MGVGWGGEVRRGEVGGRVVGKVVAKVVGVGGGGFLGGGDGLSGWEAGYLGFGSDMCELSMEDLLYVEHRVLFQNVKGLYGKSVRRRNAGCSRSS